MIFVYINKGSIAGGSFFFFIFLGALNGIRAAIHRHITQPPLLRPINILNGPAFTSANQAFRCACKRFKRDGGKKPQHKAQISKEDMEKLVSYFNSWRISPIVLQTCCMVSVVLPFWTTWS